MLSELNNYKKIINKLLEENYMRVSDIKESIAYLTIPDLKEILRTKKLKLTGRKSELLDRIFENFSDDELKGYVKNRRYILTELGTEELKNNPPEGYYDVSKLNTEALIKNIVQEDAPNTVNKKWYQKSWGIGLLLLCVFPVGAYLLWKYGEFNVKIKKILTGIFAVIFLIMIFSSGNDNQELAKENVTQTEQQEPAPAQKEKKEIPPQVQSVMDSTNVDETQAEKIVSILQQCGAGDFTITNSKFNRDGKTYEISSDGKILALALLANNAIGNVTYDGQVLYNSKTNAVEHTISDIVTLHNYDQHGTELLAAYADKEKTVKNMQVAGDSIRTVFAKGNHYEGQPIIISEYGGIALQDGASDAWGYGKKADGQEAYLKRFGGLTSAIKSMSYMCGYCLTQLTDVMQEKNGLFDMARTEKVPITKIKEINDDQIF